MTTRFWASLQVFHPFAPPREHWRWYRYQVQPATEEVLETKHSVWKVFVHCVRGEWWVHERSSGGLLCDAGTKEKAVRYATELIAHTPDFVRQLVDLGPALTRPEMDPREAVDRQWRALHQPS